MSEHEGIVQCVPNFSEGRDPNIISAIVAAAGSIAGVRLADWSADPDHNRMVVTLVGPLISVKAAMLAAAEVAIARIDLARHSGAHPRLGAVDVIPFVPVKNLTMEVCATAAREVGREIAERFDVPVFLYEFASQSAAKLPDIRKGAFTEIMPDLGPAHPHATAGATVVGARHPLIAYNVDLVTRDLRIARTIARELREGGAARFSGVRSLALDLAGRGVTQVSMNIIDTRSVRIHALFRYIERRAAELGTVVSRSEVIGVLPGYTAFGLMGDALQEPGLKPGQILWENWPG